MVEKTEYGVQRRSTESEYGVRSQKLMFKNDIITSLRLFHFIATIVLNESDRSVIHSFLCETLMGLIINNLQSIITRLRLFHYGGIKWKRRSLAPK